MAEVVMKRGNLEFGFFRCKDKISGEAKIYWGMVHGKWDLNFPVKNGKISRNDDHLALFSSEKVTVIPLQEMANHGMQIKQGDNPMDPRFWE